MLAIVLLALLASAAALSFQRPMQIARAQDAVEAIRSFDAACRQTACRFGRPNMLAFDLATSRLERHDGSQITYQAQLPHACRIRQLRTAARRVSEDQIEIPCSAAGLTRTYAVRLVGAGVDQWLLVSGLSGEIKPIKDEAQLDAIFAATATRADALEAESTSSDDAH